jgi:hypothetical protein
MSKTRSTRKSDIDELVLPETTGGVKTVARTMKELKEELQQLKKEKQDFLELKKLNDKLLEDNKQLKEDNLKLLAEVETLKVQLENIKEQKEEKEEKTKKSYSEIAAVRGKIDDSYAKKGKQNLQKKIQNNKPLKANEVDTIVSLLNTAPSAPKKFVKVYLEIKNKHILSNCSYKAKISTIQRILTHYGLKDMIIRLSFIGNNLVELYMIEEFKERVMNRFIEMDWNILEHIDHPDFTSTDEKLKFAFINRLSWLLASTKIRNLKECILEGVEETLASKIIETADSLIQNREAKLKSKVVVKQEVQGERAADAQNPQ